MNREIVLVQAPLVTVIRFDHAAEEPHRDPPEETAGFFTVSFVEQGLFEIATLGRSQTFSKGMAFLTWPALRYRTRHAGEWPKDSCLSIQYGDELAAQALKPGRISLFSTNRLAYNRLRLVRSCTASADPLALETAGAELLAAVAEAGASERPLREYRAAQLAWYAQRIDAVRELLAERFAEPHSLASLAREAGMSPYHFAHIFRELTGTAPHRYLLSVRLTEALRQLRAGKSVTDTCFDAGFSNLSHFSRLFRRRYGASPSRCR